MEGRREKLKNSSGHRPRSGDHDVMVVVKVQEREGPRVTLTLLAGASGQRMKPFTEKIVLRIGLWEQENEFNFGSIVSRVFASGGV